VTQKQGKGANKSPFEALKKPSKKGKVSEYTANLKKKNEWHFIKKRLATPGVDTCQQGLTEPSNH